MNLDLRVELKHLGEEGDLGSAPTLILTITSPLPLHLPHPPSQNPRNLQFSSTPLDSPADPICNKTGSNYQQHSHPILTGSAPTNLHCIPTSGASSHHPSHHHNPNHNNGWAGYPASTHLSSGVMYNTNPNGLPDSPPITDISGGSSGSPSTNSDPPYSPDQYPYSGKWRMRVGKIRGVSFIVSGYLRGLGSGDSWDPTPI